LGATIQVMLVMEESGMEYFDAEGRR